MWHLERDIHVIKAESHNEHGEVWALNTPRVGVEKWGI